MAKAKPKSILAEILIEIAPRIGARVTLEPVWGYVGQITYASGVKRYFRSSTLDINRVGASDIAKDKGYAKYFMRLMGYQTIPGETFYSKSWAKAIRSKKGIDAAYRYTKRIGFPVVVKPNSRSQGNGVMKAHNKTEFYQAARWAFAKDSTILVERTIIGKDYRIVVLDDTIISAYERIPLQVVGNGRSTIELLLKAKQRMFVRQGRDTQIDFSDPRIKAKLKRQHLTLQSVLEVGDAIFLLDNANLSTGGESVDVTDIVHPEMAKMAVKLTKDMGLRLCGVDVIVPISIDQSLKSGYHIIEVNSAPGLDHYAALGDKQRKIVEDLYLQVLVAMET